MAVAEEEESIVAVVSVGIVRQICREARGGLRGLVVEIEFLRRGVRHRIARHLAHVALHTQLLRIVEIGVGIALRHIYFAYALHGALRLRRTGSRLDHHVIIFQGLVLIAQIHVGQPQIRQRLRMIARIGILRYEILQYLHPVGVTFVGDVGAAQLVCGGIDIIAAVGLHDTAQALDLAISLILHAERHGAAVFGIVFLRRIDRGGIVVTLYRLVELARRVICVAATVERVGAIGVATRTQREELGESIGRGIHLAVVEVTVTDVVLRHGVLLAAAGSASHEAAITLQGAAAVALGVCYLAQPERRQSVVLGVETHAQRLGERTLRFVQLSCRIGLQTVEIGYLLQRLQGVVIGIRQTLDGIVRLGVVVRIVVSGYEQRARLGHARRRGVKLDVTAQHVDSLVEHASAELVLQLAVIEQSVLGYVAVELRARRHGERPHGVGLVARTQIAVGQMVRRVLRKHVVGAARLTQIIGRLGVKRLPIERITHDVVLHALHLAARALERVHVSGSGVVIPYLEPRFGHHAAYLRTLLGRCALDQGVALVDHGAVVAALEIDLQQIIGHQVAIERTAEQRVEPVAGALVIAVCIRHVGFVIGGMVGIVAARL